ncbi:hypothetical protein CYY_006635 [Polysphondylium violaceum]|uniref:Transmembrane protein n=1 Tax=Polysphondylium violaceum TaxID=133409 RepID=A0A8J4UY44_9MYCE|nr:hypothetical protein CYY_006635 [Polysphondylium violaceum]
MINNNNNEIPLEEFSPPSLGRSDQSVGSSGSSISGDLESQGGLNSTLDKSIGTSLGTSLEISTDKEQKIQDEENFDKDADILKNKIGWRGLKTVRLMMERYLYGIIVAVVVSLFIVILSLPNWSGAEAHYLNIKTYSIFFSFAILLFGPIYVTLSFLVSYGLENVKKSKILMYTVAASIVFCILFAVLYLKGVKYWFYYLDALAVLVVYCLGEVICAYRISGVLQKEENPVQKINVVKALTLAYNYAAPDICVTVFTLIYMFFLIPIYLTINSSILRLGWRLIIHPAYWTLIVMIARQFLTKDICTEDIMRNSNIVLHTFFHHQTLGKIFVYTFSDDGALTEIGMVISAIEDIILRSLALKRDEWFFTLLIGREKARAHVYSQQSLQLRAAILNIQVSLEFSGLITAPLFVYMFQKHRVVFHFFDGPNIAPVTLLYQSILSISLDVMAEFICTYIETRFYKLPIYHTWRWMKSNKGFLCWIVYGSLSMGLLAMIWTCARVPRAGLCTSDDICTCSSIIASSIPEWCYNSNSTLSTMTM